MGVSPRSLRLLAVALAGALTAAMPAAAAADPAFGPMCTTPTSTAANVDTDCLNDGSTSFETTLAVNPTNPSNLVGAAISGQGGGTSFTGTVRPRVSFDGGRTWTTVAVRFGGYADSIDPSVAFDASGTVYLAVAASGKNSRPDIVVVHSSDGGTTWSSPERVAAGSGSSGAGIYNDHPKLATTGSGTVLVTWIRSFFGPGGSFIDAPVYDAVSHDSAESFSDPTSISGSAPFCSGSQGEDACDLTFGNSVTMTSTGAVVAFQDTYQNAPDGSTNLGRNKHMVVTVDPATGMRTGGPYLVGQAYDGINEHDFPVDARGLQTLQDSQLNLDLDGDMATDPTDGQHLAVTWYDDRNAPHPVNPDPYQAVTNTDIVVSQSFDGGRTWSAPTTIPAAGDQFMPAAAYDPSGRLRLGYYDRSYDPANHSYGYTLATETTPGALSFSTAEVSTALSDPTQGTLGLGFTINPTFPNPAFGIGDYTAIAMTPTSVDAYWTDMREQVCLNGQCGSTEDAFFASVPLG
ncbi:MAG TPA: hypothetical protein VG388_11415 [Solirubrobacteraceae bacterium]|nr:hypothetical protein [Solirubrobacteraceae bacterium]